jgi:hypothetical protein
MPYQIFLIENKNIFNILFYDSSMEDNIPTMTLRNKSRNGFPGYFLETEFVDPAIGRYTQTSFFGIRENPDDSQVLDIYYISPHDKKVITDQDIKEESTHAEDAKIKLDSFVGDALHQMVLGFCSDVGHHRKRNPSGKVRFFNEIRNPPKVQIFSDPTTQPLI